jgi:hypothetical protein
VKIVAYDGKHKIADRWESEPYTVLSQPNKDIPVYKVQREDKSGRTRTLHRNLLLPISFIPENRVNIVPIPAPRQRNSRDLEPILKPKTQQIKTASAPLGSGDSESESEDDLVIKVTQHTGRNTEIDKEPEDLVEQDTQELPDVESEGDGEMAAAAEEDTQEDVQEDIERDTLQDIQNTDISADMSESDEDIGEPRRPTRTRTKPKWITSGDFVVNQQLAEPEWKDKAEFLLKISKDPSFTGQEKNRLLDGILSVVTGIT